MRRYLEKILQSQPINYPAFLKTLPEPFGDRHRRIFQAQKVATNRWLVQIADQQAFDELLALARAPESRVQAARQGDSHSHGTGISFLLVYHHQLATARPDTVVISETGVDMGFAPAPSALVVENESNFYHYQAMLAFAAHTAGSHLSLDHCDVILGGGNRITSARNVDWLDGYQQVFCAFDYDVGGLQMFASLASRLGRKARFVEPADWQAWQGHFCLSPKSTQRFTKALSLAEDLGFTGLAQAFRSTGKFMEQEMILDD